MSTRLIDKVIRRTGRQGYTVDPGIKTGALLILLRGKLFQVLRGWMLKPFLKGSAGLLFVGRRCKITYGKQIQLGRSVTIGDGVEIMALSKEGVRIGDNVSILSHTIIECTGVIRSLGEGLVIGNRVGIAQHGFIQVRGKVVIGDDVIFGPHVSIYSETHNFDNPDIPVSQQGETRIGVTIESGAWIGANATILDGVTIGKNSVVAAGAVVTRSVPPHTVVGGIPAKQIK